MKRRNLLMFMMFGLWSTVACSAMSSAMNDVPAPAKESLLFVGGGSATINVYRFDRGTGTPTFLKSISTPNVNPTFLAIDAKHKRLFAANENADGGAKAFHIDSSSGELSALNAVSLQGGATHVSLDPTGRFLFAASYSSGLIASYPIDADGKLGKAVSELYAGQNAHQIVADARGDTVLVPCLGSNHIAQYALDAESGALTPKDPATLGTGSGGPRHLAIHPNQRWAYLMNEYGSSVQALSLEQGRAQLLGPAVSSLQTSIYNTGAEVQVHPNGKFVYASNRGDDSIASFAVQDDGQISLLETVKTGGQSPRHFSIDASGAWLFVANQNSNQVTIMKIDAATGKLSLQPTALPFGSAQFVELVDF